jgi:hypothetical protein
LALVRLLQAPELLAPPLAQERLDLAAAAWLARSALRVVPLGLALAALAQEL